MRRSMCFAAVGMHASNCRESGATQLAVELGASSLRPPGAGDESAHGALGKSETVATLVPRCDFIWELKQYGAAGN